MGSPFGDFKGKGKGKGMGMGMPELDQFKGKGKGKGSFRAGSQDADFDGGFLPGEVDPADDPEV